MKKIPTINSAHGSDTRNIINEIIKAINDRGLEILSESSFLNWLDKNGVKHVGEWDNTKEYDSLSVVLHEGNSYTSKKQTPAGIDIKNEEYWVLTGNYNAQVEYYRDEVGKVEEGIQTLQGRVDINDLKSEVIGTPDLYGAYGDGVNDDTEYIQQTIDNYEIIDLKGKTYLTDTLTIKSNQTIKNGNLISNGKNVILKSERTENVTLEKINFNGLNQSITGVNFYSNNDDFFCKNIIIKECTFKDFYNDGGTSSAIWLKRCQYSIIKDSFINGVESVPNNVIGDDFGGARGIVFTDCKDSLVDNVKISNIYSDDDADGIHFIGEQLDGHNTLRNCDISNCQSRMVKIQQPHVSIINNKLYTNDDYRYTNSMRVAGMTSYANNTKIIENSIDTQSDRQLQIGGGSYETLNNIKLYGNDIYNTTGNNQGGITLGGEITEKITNLEILNNNFYGNGNSHVGIQVRVTVKDLIIKGNKVFNLLHGIYIRNIDVILSENSENVIIQGNNFEIEKSPVRIETGNLVSNLIVTENNFKATNPDSFSIAQNTVYAPSAQWNELPIVHSNTFIGLSFDGIRKSGYTSHRPENGLETGFEFFDRSLGFPVYWDGEKWVDGQGVEV